MAAATFVLQLVLPEVPDARDGCVAKLRALIDAHPAVTLVHDKRQGDVICVHYDPAQMTLRGVRRLVAAAGASLSAEVGHVTVPFRASPGEDAGRRLEDILRRVVGVLEVSVSVAAGQVHLEFDRARTDDVALARVVDEAGFPAVGRSDAPGKKAIELSWFSAHRELIWSVCAAGLLLAGWIGERFAGWPTALTLPLFLGAYGFASWDLLRHTVAGIRRGVFALDIDLLMLVAAIGAAALGEWAEGAFLLTLFALAHALEHYALGRARRAISALAELAPATARVRRDGADVEVPVETVRVDEIVLIRPGERLPVDGVVSAGASAINQAPVTGESVPVDKEAGDEVFAGTINGEGALEVRTTRAVGDRTLDRVIRLVEDAQTAKAPTQQFTERFERVFVPVVLVSSALVMIVPPLAGWATWPASIYRALALLVAASPCALALGTPSAVLAGIAHAARRGVLIKGGVHLENLGTVRAIAFDKTGTLTIGLPEVTDVEPADEVSADTLLSVAAGVERQSQHPLAQAVVRAAVARRLQPVEAGPLESITARGVRATVDGALVEIGNARLWNEQQIPIPVSVLQSVDRLQSGGRSVMIVKHGPRWLGVLGLADQPRPEAKAVLTQLRATSVQSLAMLTGDNNGVARAVAADLGINDVRADLLPEDKVTAIQGLMRDYGALAMVGDGVNDAPALAQATVGIAMGGAGTGVALETADVALMGDDLTTLPFAIGLSRQAARVIRQNLAISMIVIAVLVVATLAGWAGIGTAVLLHEGSTLIALANSLRLLLYNASQERSFASASRMTSWDGTPPR